MCTLVGETRHSDIAFKMRSREVKHRANSCLICVKDALFEVDGAAFTSNKD
jgi:hypothetical protein